MNDLSHTKMNVMTLSPAAVARVREIVAASPEPVAGLRIGIDKGGCAGMSYTMDLVATPLAGDEIVEQDGARVYIDAGAVLFIIGTEMDFEITKLASGFVFNNPNQVSACGCGESVHLERADLETLRQI